jgi:hypothetical protein
MEKLVLIALIMCLIPSIGLSATNAGRGGTNIWDVITPIVVLIVSPLLVRLFKKLGIDLTTDQLDPILVKIIELIARVEEKYPNAVGSEKKAKVIDLALETLSQKELNKIQKKYGKVETAVQAAFERSAIALK